MLIDALRNSVEQIFKMSFDSHRFGFDFVFLFACILNHFSTRFTHADINERHDIGLD